MGRIQRIVAAPSPYGPALVTLAYGVLSGTVSQFLGGGWREVVVATSLGLMLGLFAIFAERRARLNRVFEPLAAFLVSAAATGLARLVGPISLSVATLAGLIVLMPGLLITTAITELAARHLASGTLRLSSAFMTLLGIVFGSVLLGVELGMFVAAFGVAMAGALYERWRHRPAPVVLVPGILLLVPGSIGYQSMSSMVERNTVAGIDTAFTLILTAVSLVAGLLIAGVVAPEPRRSTATPIDLAP